MKKGDKLLKDGCKGDFTDDSWSRMGFKCEYDTITCWDCIYAQGRRNPQSKRSMSIPKLRKERMWREWRECK